MTIDEEAKKRHKRHINHPTHRPLSPGYELIGLLGEKALAEFVGGEVDMEPRPNGDGGVDNVIHTIHGDFRVDVKTARKPYHLIVEQGKVRRLTIYILGEFIDEQEPWVRLIGWEWSAVVRAAPCKDFGYGVINHYIPAKALRSMGELRQVSTESGDVFI